jgi:aryl-alcohol dehydrogenase-like predicted oxidoreductase
VRIRKLGRTGLKVSNLCLGAMTFGNSQWGCDEGTSRKIVDRFLDAGGNFIDTADVYSNGVSEEITGRAIREKRPQVVLATKVAGPMGRGPNDLGLSRKHILDAVDASLRRLGSDWIDLYQVHAYDPTTPLDETLRALDDCVRAGKVRYVGCSNYSAWQLMKATALARELGTVRYDCLQPQYSLACRTIEREHLPLCLEEGIGVIPWSPLGGGLLTGKVRRGKEIPKGARASVDPNWERFRDERSLAIAEAVIEVAQGLGRTPSQVALAWAAGRPGITSPIFGARALEQLEDNLAAADLELDAEAVRRLDEVSKLELVYPYDFHERVRAITAQMRAQL